VIESRRGADRDVSKRDDGICEAEMRMCERGCGGVRRCGNALSSGKRKDRNSTRVIMTAAGTGTHVLGLGSPPL